CVTAIACPRGTRTALTADPQQGGHPARPAPTTKEHTMGEPHTTPYDEELAELLGLPAPEPEEPARQVPPGQRVQVQVDMRHLRNYGRESKVHLSYGCTFPVALGDQVRVPPPPQDQRWLMGTV